MRPKGFSFWGLTGLRTQYAPKSRLGQGLLSLAPWINLVLLVQCFLWLDSKLVLQPGVHVELPSVPFTAGARPEHLAVVMDVRGRQVGGRQTIVFFDDDRFVVGQSKDRQELRDAIARCMGGGEDAVLVLQVDEGVSYGVAVDLMSLAAEAGVRQVHLAGRTPSRTGEAR